MVDKLVDVELEQKHGKSRVRLGRMWRHGSQHVFVEWSVSILLSSECVHAYTSGDNSSIVATDTMKNTVYAKAKDCREEISVEEFGTLLGQHFVTTYKEVSGAKIHIVEKPWKQVMIEGKLHGHGYKLRKGDRTCEVVVDGNGSVAVSSGIEGLSVLKATQSGFEGFIRDKYTLLPEVHERILATEIRCVWRYQSKPVCYNKAYKNVTDTILNTFFGPPETGVYSPSVQNTLYLMGREVLRRFSEIEFIKLSMPNLHFLPVNMPTIGIKFDHDVYLPTDEPHGTIEASLTRKQCKPCSKL